MTLRSWVMAEARKERREPVEAGPASSLVQTVLERRKNQVVSPEMCCYCFDVLIGHLNGGHSHKTAYYIPNDEL